ncbi:MULTISPECIES: alpha/beta hydrolase [unclassified Amycolatopsis]|uniref:alpha/beta fold hydrolase n=1 Tax=unclassified Amycolatopsis TaxID=2618356 RepID=UPI002875792F|nr:MULTISPECIES: alpha/beta hydrolase [unclassified Amycolatopsis]MDS0139369.1 alpha/beta hydrolase [Amycolatopsis sp. 505]MDS0149520.1 alpha/beta hydrolase [Amycolatopsis sp. CM201R]
MTTLAVPGATLTYDVDGTGPALLLVPGGPADAQVFTHLRPLLAEDHTVVTFDPRGLSRSPLDGTPGPDPVGDHAGDVHRLLAEVGPADVLASSGGAITLLELLRHHAGDVGTVVLHEPPVTRYLPAFDGPDIPALFRDEGLAAAFAAFMKVVGVDPAPPLDPRAEGNFAYFFGHLMPATGTYEPDLDALRATPARLVVAVGEQSTAMPVHQAALGLAAALGVETAVFPGGHGGFDTHAEAFAARLREVLKGC